ncbi:hypothetical protein ACVIN2_005067 [Bradyrhizobium sp. USDA 3650]
MILILRSRGTRRLEGCRPDWGSWFETALRASSS